jgi:uncharacterized protein YbjT (DUF2867 family)
MKIVVIGGSGLIGKKLIPLLRAQGHDAQSASRSTGINAVTGEGLAEALRGADVVVDVSNSPSFADDEVMQFFSASTRNLLAAEADAGVKHHVALSVVGADRLPDSGYMRAKVAQENLIKSSSVPYTVLRATQFFEFLGAIAYGSTVGNIIRLPTRRCNPSLRMKWPQPWPKLRLGLQRTKCLSWLARNHFRSPSSFRSFSRAAAISGQ